MCDEWTATNAQRRTHIKTIETNLTKVHPAQNVVQQDKLLRRNKLPELSCMQFKFKEFIKFLLFYL